MLLLTAALISPQITNSVTSEQWHLMKSWTTGSRYFVVPMIIFIGVLFWSWSNIQIQFIKKILVVAMIITIYGMTIDFHVRPLKDFYWKEQVDKFQRSPIGETYSIPINPKGWYCKLEK